jgi:hypothetical protein
LLLTILFTSVVDVSVRFFTSGEFLIFSKPLKTLVKKFDHPIPIIARIIIAIKTIMISVLTNYHHIYSKTAIKTTCVLFYFKVEYAYFYYNQMLLRPLRSKLFINLIINEIDKFCLVNFFYRTC